MTILAATGHRPDKLGGWTDPNPTRLWVRQKIRDAIIEIEPIFGISGMAVGVDQDFTEICVELGVPFTAAVPFKGQEAHWHPQTQRIYDRLLAKASKVVYVCEPGYALWKMYARNQWMVDNCEKLLAVFDGSDGGTANTVLYAQSIQRDMYPIINPKDFEGHPAHALRRQDSR